MSNFDEWFENNYWQLSADIDEAKDTYKAGAASRQAEVDALQKRIDEALMAFQDGSFNYCEKILKGESK